MTTMYAPRSAETSGATVSGQARFFSNALWSAARITESLPLTERLAICDGTLIVPDSPLWFDPTIQAMLALPWDNGNWNDAAAATQPRAAATLLVALVHVLDDAAPPPAIVPTWRGGVQAEWSRNGMDLEIAADPDGALEYYFRSATEEYEEPALPNIERLTRLARSVFS